MWVTGRPIGVFVPAARRCRVFWGVAVFSVLCWVAFALLIGCYAVLSVRRGRVLPGLWLAVGILSMSWIESPFDNVMYAVFHPDFARLPAVGPIGMTQGGLPVMAPPGYVMYFLVPAMIGVAPAQWLTRRRGWGEQRTLLAAGLIVGLAWDGLIETVQASTLRLWQFGRATDGVTLFPGTTAQIPVLVWPSMAVFIMCAGYLLGRVVGDDRPVLEAYVAGRVAPGRRRSAATLIAYVVAAHAVYLAMFLPWAIVKQADLMAPGPVLRPYPEIAVQPGGPQSSGWLGTTIIAAWLLAAIVLVYALVGRFEAAARRGVASAQPAARTSVPA